MSTLTKQDREYIAGSLATLAVSGTVAAVLIPPYAAVISITIATSVVLYRMMVNHRKMSQSVARQNEILYQQTESYYSVLTMLGVSGPLPFTRGYSASPDFLRLIANHVLLRKPSVILEASSGLSTVILAYCCKKLGTGRVISLEHLKEYADKTNRLLAEHGLSDFATVHHTPLKNTTIGDRTYHWYSIDSIKFPETIDCIVVDGPVSGEHPYCRYPALPLFFDKMPDGSSLIMDDAFRKNEREVASMWEKELAGKIDTALIDCEKGALQVTRKNA